MILSCFMWLNQSKNVECRLLCLPCISLFWPPVQGEGRPSCLPSVGLFWHSPYGIFNLAAISFLPTNPRQIAVHPRCTCTLIDYPLWGGSLQPNKHKIFVKHFYNVRPTSSTLVKHCMNAIQIFCVFWEARKGKPWPTIWNTLPQLYDSVTEKHISRARNMHQL